MVYRGYTAHIEFDDSVQAFHGRVIDVRDVITFEGSSVDELRCAFRTSVDDYLALCEAEGVEPDRPFSGRFLVRIDPDLHRAATVAATCADASLNEWVTGAIEARLTAPAAPSLVP